MKKLVLIDGNAIIHRAYHALPKTLSNRKGELTNAVYGFTTTLIKVIKDLKPEYIVASFDLKGKTFRHDEYEDYKATREKADQELYDQIPRVKEVVRAMEIPIYEKEEYEADDIIGTIAALLTDKSQALISNSAGHKLSGDFVGTSPLDGAETNSKFENQNVKNDIEIYIVSGDKDIFQLVNGGVRVYNLRRGLSDMEIVDRKKIKEDYGLEPEDFIDLKALQGDASDNIPGVPGIGPKKATELLVQFDNLKNVYSELEKTVEKYDEDVKPGEELKPDVVKKVKKDLGIWPSVVKNLWLYKEQAFMSQSLATIKCDVDVDFSLEDARFGEYDKGSLRDLFEELGFISLIRRLNDGKDVKSSINEKKNTKEVAEKSSGNGGQIKLL